MHNPPYSDNFKRSEINVTLQSKQQFEQPAELVAASADLKRLFENTHAGDALLLTQFQDAVMFCDPEWRIIYVNDAFGRLLGWPATQVVGKHVTFRFPPEICGIVERHLARIVFGQPFSGDWEDYRCDGSRVWVHWRAQRVVDSVGRVVGTVNVGTDISLRKIAEAEREELQQQLLQAQKLDTLGSLAGGIAHDFNNILAVIFGFTELALARPQRDPQIQHHHEQVLKATERGRDLVKRILSFSRFHEPERKPCNLVEVLGDAAKFIRATLPSSLEVVTESEICPPTLADPHQLHQVLLNLATNAAHAIPNQRGVFKLKLMQRTIAARRTTATGIVELGKYVVIEVADSGAGMDQKTQRRIFEPFFTTKREGEGTGLGLSVVSAILSGHGGSVDVESVVGQGTTFTLYLPLVDGVRAPGSPVHEPLAPRMRSRGETAAIIDDEEAVVSVTEKVLQALGYSTMTFSSAEKFFALFMTAPTGIHIVVTDQTMPGMSGLELARRLRDSGHQLPVLLMTGFSKQLRPEIVATLGRAALLRKPFDRVLLATTVRELLDGPYDPDLDT